MKKKPFLILESLFLLIGMVGLQACFFGPSGPPPRGYGYGGPPAYAYNAPPRVVYGDYDAHHVWHDRGWWVQHDHRWVESHHPDWIHH
jgi:hypothetical protein